MRCSQMWIEATPLARLETPEDVAKVVAFLASEDAGVPHRRSDLGERRRLHGLTALGRQDHRRSCRDDHGVLALGDQTPVARAQCPTVGVFDDHLG